MPINAGFATNPNDIKTGGNPKKNPELPWKLFLKDKVPYRLSFLHPYELCEDLLVHQNTEAPWVHICEKMYYPPDEQASVNCDECNQPPRFGDKSKKNNPKKRRAFLAYVYDLIGQQVLDKDKKPKVNKDGEPIIDDPLKVVEISQGKDEVNFEILKLQSDKGFFQSKVWTLQKMGDAGLLPPTACKPGEYEDEFDARIPDEIAKKFGVSITDSNDVKDLLRVRLLSGYGNVKWNLIPNSRGDGSLAELAHKLLGTPESEGEQDTVLSSLDD